MATDDDVEKKVIKQVEYYFGDCNLPRDRFLREQVKQDDGWVPLETMLKFNRLKQITEDVAVVAESLRKSTSGLIEVNEDGTKIRRNPENPIPEHSIDRRKELATRTVYSKVFPLDTSLDVLQEFFEGYGEIDSVTMRKDVKKLFKGSVFVTFKSEDSAKKFLEAESVKFNDVELEKRLSSNDYHQQKADARQNVKSEKQNKREMAHTRQKVDEDQKVENEMPNNAILHLKGLSSDSSREDIKNMLQDYGPIAWVDFDRGDVECFVRYDQENKAKEVLEKVSEAMDNEITLNGSKLESCVLEGEEAVAKWKKMYVDSLRRRQGNKNKNKNYGRKPGGARFGKRPSKATRDAAKGRGQSGGDCDGEPPKKQAKVEGANGD